MDDIKLKHKILQNGNAHVCFDYVQPQSHSPYHVHPYPSPVRLQHAFQQPALAKGFVRPYGDTNGMRTHVTPTDSPILGRAICFTPKDSPIPGRVSRLSDKLDTITISSDTETLAAKINAMFPTVSETHIKLLLKKYYNREAVVISALQVEKHPITTPGPMTSSPFVSRLQRGVTGVYSALTLSKGHSGSTQGNTPLTGSPNSSPYMFRPGSRASSYYGSPRSVDGHTPKPHPSPKMKLRYLKSLFPKAEETIILDVLANKDNHVQKATEELVSMGFNKKDPSATPPRQTPPKTPPLPSKKIMKPKTMEEKIELREKFQIKYNTIPAKVVAIALESVDYNEDRAEQILTVVVQEDILAKSKPAGEANANIPENVERSNDEQEESNNMIKRKSEEKLVDGRNGEIMKTDTLNVNQKAQEPTKGSFFKNFRQKFRIERLKPTPVQKNCNDTGFISVFKTPASGPNPYLRTGPKDNLLLEDYMLWNGPNPDLRSSYNITTEGPQARKSAHISKARGTNASFVNGTASLAKGSIYHNPLKLCIR